MAALVALIMMMLIAAIILGTYESITEAVYWAKFRRRMRARRGNLGNWCR